MGVNETLRERAVRLLARREHSRAELTRKLAPHAESPEDVVAVLDELVARHLLSDERYVEMRLNHRSARYGNARLAQELRTQGVDGALVASALADCDDEVSRAHQVWAKKFGERPPATDAAERAKQMRFLISRGFSSETVRRVLRGDFEDE